MMYCPSLSAYYGTGNPGEIPSSSKLAGLFIRQTDDPTSDMVLAPNFWTVNRGSYTLSQVYGSQGDTIGESAMIWASHLTANMNIPAACTAGSVTYGVTTFGGITNRDAGNQISINDLMRTSIRTTKVTPGNLKVQL